MKKINELVAGGIDLHVHCGPETFIERRLNAYELALEAQKAGMRAVVIKNHEFCTAPLAQLVNIINNVPILVGSLVLNKHVGGLNPDIVEVAAQAGAKIIWLPTFLGGGRNNPPEKQVAVTHSEKKRERDINTLNPDGSIVPELISILDIIQHYNLVLATGHISISQAIAVATQALEKKINVIITHPFTKSQGNSMKMEQAQELVSKGAIIEFCFQFCMPPARISPEELISYIRILGAENCILSSDFGQAVNPPPAEGFRMMVTNMLRYGLTEKELEVLVKVNPARLLKLS